MNWAYGESGIEISAVAGEWVLFICGNWIACGASCGLRVEIEGESIPGFGHLILRSGGVFILCGVDCFGVEIFARQRWFGRGGNIEWEWRGGFVAVSVTAAVACKLEAGNRRFMSAGPSYYGYDYAEN